MQLTVPFSQQTCLTAGLAAGHEFLLSGPFLFQLANGGHMDVSLLAANACRCCFDAV